MSKGSPRNVHHNATFNHVAAAAAADAVGQAVVEDDLDSLLVLIRRSPEEVSDELLLPPSGRRCWCRRRRRDDALTLATRLGRHRLVPPLLELWLQRCCEKMAAAEADEETTTWKAAARRRLQELVDLLLEKSLTEEFPRQQLEKLDGGTGNADESDLNTVGDRLGPSSVSEIIESAPLNFRSQPGLDAVTSTAADCLRYILQRCHAAPNIPVVLPQDEVGGLNGWLTGETMLTTAVRRRHVNLVCTLLAFGRPELQLRRNRRRQTALDVLIESMFPIDRSSQHHHVYFRPQPAACDGADDIDRLWTLMRTLLKSGGSRLIVRSSWICWLLLHGMHDPEFIRLLCVHCVDEQAPPHPAEPVDVDAEKSARQLRRLLIQVAVKYAQTDNIALLLRHGGLYVDEFWTPKTIQTAARRILPNDAMVTWKTVGRLSTVPDGFATLCERIFEGLPLPLTGASTLLRAANSRRVARRVVDDLLKGCDIEDNFQTGKAVEVYYPYAWMCHLDKTETNGLLVKLAECLPGLDPDTIDALCRQYGLNSSVYWQRVANNSRCQGHRSVQGQRQPGRLKNLARRCVRLNVRQNVFYGVEQLRQQLPVSLRNFVVNVED